MGERWQQSKPHTPPPEKQTGDLSLIVNDLPSERTRHGKGPAESSTPDMAKVQQKLHDISPYTQ